MQLLSTLNAEIPNVYSDFASCINETHEHKITSTGREEEHTLASVSAWYPCVQGQQKY